MLAQKDKHQMHKTGTNGHREIWECPVCHRVIMVQWNPFRRIIIEDGDENADHYGTKGTGIDLNLNVYDGRGEENNNQIISDELSDLLDDLDFLSF